MWPFTVQAIVDRYNRLTLNAHGRSSLEIFTGEDEYIRTEDFRTWGYPVYILNASNQSGGIETSKWEPRSHIEIYLGRSSVHAGNVSLALNLHTGLVSLQYHLIFDDEFTTVKYLRSSSPSPNWTNLLRHNTVSVPIDSDDTINKTWLHPEKVDRHDTMASEGVVSDAVTTAALSSQPVTHPTNQTHPILISSESGGETMRQTWLNICPQTQDIQTPSLT